MADKAKVERYFNQVVQGYNCGDVRVLLELKLSQAGPLLTSVMNGVDIVGGMVYGFGPHNSMSRSTQFMTKYLGVSEQEAKVLYALVRCGMDHEGTTKCAIRFFVHYKRIKPGVFLYDDNENCIWLNVSELAYTYLAAVDSISKDLPTHVSHVPVASPKDEDFFLNALSKIPTDIGDFCLAAAQARNAAEEADAEINGLKERSSSSPFLKEHLKGFSTPAV